MKYKAKESKERKIKHNMKVVFDFLFRNVQKITC